MVKFSVLDQSIVEPKLTNETILHNTVNLAQLAESYGYKRFWVSEHHNSKGILGSSPEVLAAYLLAKTKKIRIGTGGVLLQHYSPYKVAENFQVLATLESNRVDLGIGKGPGGFPISTKALQFGQFSNGQDFESRFEFLLQILRNEIPEESEFVGLKATPEPAIPQEIILLGTSEESALYAAKQNVSYTFGTTFTPDEYVWQGASRAFRSVNSEGHLIFSVAVVVADTEEEANEIAIKRDIVKVYFENHRVVTLLDEESAKRFGEESGLAYEIKVFPMKLFTGTKKRVFEQLQQLAKQYNVDEFLIQTPVATYEQRKKSLQLLGEEILVAETVTV